LAEALLDDDRVNDNPPTLEASTVIYDKGSDQDVKPDLAEVNRLRWMQKPESFELEREYRVHFQTCTLKKISVKGIYWLKVPNGIGSHSINKIGESKR
jgi:hypothetical protein